MAVVWLYRAAFVAAGAGLRLLQQAAGPGADRIIHVSQGTLDFLTAGVEPDEALTARVQGENPDTVVLVTTFAEPFEVRRVQLSWDLDGGGLGKEDVRVCTFHLLKLTGGVPDDTWIAGDFTASKNLFDNWWTAIKPWFPNNLQMVSIKYYREGPEIAPPQPPVFAETRAVTGLSSVGQCLPSQVAMSVTERAGAKLNWGRFFLPAPATEKNIGSIKTLTDFGRWGPEIRADIAAATDTMYEAHATAGLPVVVYRAPLPVRQTAAERRAGTEPGSIPARAGSAWTVTELAIDDVPDVIRSRRPDAPLLRTVAPVAGS